MQKVFLIAVAFLLSCPSQAAVPAPRVDMDDIADLPTPLPYPFDEDADANTDVAHAFDLADASGKRVLIDLGANWCADCRILDAIMELPEVHAFILQHFEVVHVDVGRFNRNLQIPGRFGLFRLRAIPAVIVADWDGTPVNVSYASDIAEARHMTPQEVADWLAHWAQ